ncbi:hypothetical protein C8A00DRAFT_43360 [Chaetomidium leptoderma]|uniref:Uncharacterized protein n=1 Tax=Chaetomidium leptoderma TaxID=669021 RepID=A0AAN6VLJ2_9PEZI|nr:hypothetical protein C8A00DRAFT_43360 [Chaetomidium leptoderma]
MNRPAPRERSEVSIDTLDLDHHQTLARAIRNILSTDLAEVTLAQLIDGLPLVSTVWDMKGSLLIKGHPLFNHDKLCQGASEQARMFRDTFKPAILRFDSQVMQSFQNAAQGSREFNMRLTELVTASIHQVAVLLFCSKSKLHSKEDIDAVVSWKIESQWVVLESGRRILEEEPLEPHPTLFYHVQYMDHELYPHGLADVAGYWAEDRILGGVVAFDRGESQSECKDIYFLSGRRRTTFRVWRLLDNQFNDMVEFLLSERPSTPPFPLLASMENRHRHDPWHAIALHNIFRDPWERKFPSTAPETRDVHAVGDYP